MLFICHQNTAVKIFHSFVCLFCRHPLLPITFYLFNTFSCWQLFMVQELTAPYNFPQSSLKRLLNSCTGHMTWRLPCRCFYNSEDRGLFTGHPHLAHMWTSPLSGQAMMIIMNDAHTSHDRDWLEEYVLLLIYLGCLYANRHSYTLVRT